MIQSAETRLNGNTLVVRIPMRFQVVSASWRLTAASLRPRRGHSPTARWVKALARAWRWQRMLDDGV